ncbi:hypothetical protein LXL04_028288 [Taraxacum kok-saghyz]
MIKIRIAPGLTYAVAQVDHPKVRIPQPHTFHRGNGVRSFKDILHGVPRGGGHLKSVCSSNPCEDHLPGFVDSEDISPTTDRVEKQYDNIAKNLVEKVDEEELEAGKFWLQNIDHDVDENDNEARVLKRYIR